jgi:DNA-binding transcriptional LysR family regulator
VIDAFTDIPTFVAVVEAGGFAAASRRMNVSRSAVGKAIARLEARLGIRLFHRTTRSQNLTDDGHAFFEHCQRAMDELSAGKAQLESGLQTMRGRLRVSMPVLFGRLCVAPVLTKLAAKHAALELELRFTDRKANLVEEGVDISIRMGEPDSSSGLIAKRIGREQMMICGSPALLQDGGPKTNEELANYPAITYSRSEWSQNWILRAEGDSLIEFAPKSRMRFDDLEAISDAAVAGYGLAWLPLWLIRRRLISGELVRVFDEQPKVSFNIYALWSPTRHMPVRIRAALDALIAEIPAFLSE